jgi:hypothetical protein
LSVVVRARGKVPPWRVGIAKVAARGVAVAAIEGLSGEALAIKGPRLREGLTRWAGIARFTVAAEDRPVTAVSRLVAEGRLRAVRALSFAVKAGLAGIGARCILAILASAGFVFAAYGRGRAGCGEARGLFLFPWFVKAGALRVVGLTLEGATLTVGALGREGLYARPGDISGARFAGFGNELLDARRDLDSVVRFGDGDGICFL